MELRSRRCRRFLPRWEQELGCKARQRLALQVHPRLVDLDSKGEDGQHVSNNRHKGLLIKGILLLPAKSYRRREVQGRRSQRLWEQWGA